jgi:hypothetical protein
MKIETYIAQLLYRYQCVTVPGFGAFLTEIQSAQLNEGSNSFFPPKKLISFNPHIKNNDGLLANHIALTEKTSYKFAVSAVHFEVLTWKKELEDNGFLSIKNVGQIRMNADKNLVFTPNDQKNYLATSFGLSPFVSPMVKRESFEKQLESLELETVEEKEPVTLYSAYKGSNSYLKYAAIFVLALGVTGSIGYPMYQNQIASQTVLVETAVQKQVQNKIQEATFFIKNPLPAVTVTLAVKEEKLTMPYHIMAGAFRSEKNAQKAYNRLKKAGFDARIIPANRHGLFPVLYGSYATMREAEKAQREIQNTINPEAWILIETL